MLVVDSSSEGDRTFGPSASSATSATKGPPRPCPHLRKGIRIGKIAKPLAAALVHRQCAGCAKTLASTNESRSMTEDQSEPSALLSSAASSKADFGASGTRPPSPAAAASPDEVQGAEPLTACIVEPQLSLAALAPPQGCTHFLCLADAKVFCARHMLEHHERKSQHLLAYGLEEGRIWCQGCTAFLVTGPNVNQLATQALAMIENAKLAKRLSKNRLLPLGLGREGDMKGTDATEGDAGSASSLATYPGLTNLGNTCFFNSVMQMVGATDGEGGATTRPTTVNPRSLFSSLCAKYPVYGDYRQQDAHELLRRLLDACHSEYAAEHKAHPSNHGSITGSSAGSNSSSRNAIDQVFGGKSLSVIVCDACGYVDYTPEAFLDISCSIGGAGAGSGTPPTPSGRGSGRERRISLASSAARRVEEVAEALAPGSSLRNAIARAEGDEEGEGKSDPLAYGVGDGEDEGDMLSMSQHMAELALCGESATSSTSAVFSKPSLPLLESILRTIRMHGQGEGSHSVLGATVSSCISSFLNVEVLSDNNLRSCDHCFRAQHGFSRERRWEALTRARNMEARGRLPPPILQKAYKRYLLLHLPPVLVVHLKRFVQTGFGRTKKVDTPVTFAETLDLRNGLAPDSVFARMRMPPPPTGYRLFGVVCHSGSLLGGHYIAYVSPRRGSWVYCSDSHTRPATWEEVCKAQVYILFYQRIPPASE